MKIKEIISQHRRDFRAIYQCESCGDEVEGTGYDDAFYHANIIPNMTCVSCNQKSPADYQPKETVYPEGYQV